MAVATMPGFTRGKATRRNAEKLEQPSIRAASISSPGTSSKKPIITHRTRGSATIKWVRIRAI